MNLRPYSHYSRSDYDSIGIPSTQITGTMKDPQLYQFDLSVPSFSMHSALRYTAASRTPIPINNLAINHDLPCCLQQHHHMQQGHQHSRHNQLQLSNATLLSETKQSYKIVGFNFFQSHCQQEIKNILTFMQMEYTLYFQCQTKDYPQNRDIKQY